MRLLVYTFLFLFLSGSLWAQANRPVCGTDDEALIPRLLDNKRALLDFHGQQRDIEYVPVAFHATAKSDGTERVNLHAVLEQLKELNEDFLSADMQFYMPDSEIQLLNNTAININPGGAQTSSMNQMRESNAMNIWIVETADDDDPGNGVTLAYYAPSFGAVSRDWIVIGKEYVRENDLTLSHEVGHFFSLAHPHRGWDDMPREEEDYQTPAPITSPGGASTELADGSNCETAGDLVCDTPADYNLGFGWGDCNFTPEVLDPVGEVLDPDERLYMGYFLNCSDDQYYFSPDQIDLMQADLASTDRNYLRQAPAPFFEDITDEVVGNYPEKDDITATYDNIVFNWTPVANARKYLFELSEFSSFTTSSTLQFITDEPFFYLDFALEPDERYYWRVTPFNDMKCGETMDDIRFETGLVSSDHEPTFVNTHRLSPNPLSSGSDLLLDLSTEEAFNGSWELFDLNGRRVSGIESVQFQAGNNQIHLPTPAVPSGVYVWRIQTESGRLSGRLLIGQ